MKLLFLMGLISLNAFAVSIKDFKPYKYEVLFTNPECPLYEYDQKVVANDGTKLTAKPKNVYCQKSDSEKQYTRENSPHKRYVDFINDKKTKELFLASLSFSNGDIAKNLCAAIKRKVKVTMVIDVGSKGRVPEGKPYPYNSLFDDLKKCDKTGKFFRGEFRGQVKGLGYAHNKILIVNPNSKKDIKIAYASGNLSTGTTIHHENWHFVTTNAKTHFAQAHLCVMNGMLDAAESKAVFKKYMAKCRSKIKAEEEDDLKVFFVPGEGGRAMKFIADSFSWADNIDMAAHRFSNKNIINLAVKAGEAGKKLRFVVDDDIYWTAVLRKNIGANRPNEVKNVNTVRLSGTDVRYMETNHNSFLLHHNKYLVFNNKKQGAVFTGAGNLTMAAFEKNFENFYYITIPEVVEAFNKQYEYVFNDLATSYKKLPTEMIMP